MIIKKKDDKNEKDFYNGIINFIFETKSDEWTKIQEKNLVSVFKNATKDVSAYKDFILKNKINSSEVKSFKKFNEVVPVVTKKNYLRAYPWEDLCKKNHLVHKPLVMTSTSGSTGDPFYFPRTKDIDLQSSISHQMFVLSSKIDSKKSILVIDCFGMGVWIGGMITYQAFKHISERGYPMTIITPGISKREIFQALRNIGTKYDQIIMCGYPPFLKDVIDEASDNGILWKNYSVKIIFAAEGFSEAFRDYIAERVGIKNIYRDIMNIYGSADLGTMAQESPLAVLIRRLALSNQSLYMKLFGQASRLPTLAQYIPNFISFEEKDSSVFCTGDNVLPLIRYQIGDNGGVLSYKKIVEIFKEEGIDLISEIKKAEIKDTVTELPFVYIYERSDFAASFYGAIMYPEYIKKGLLNEALSDYITGKFTMYTKNDSRQDQYLEINIEMKYGQKATKTLSSKIIKSLHGALLLQSTEYKKLAESLGDRVYPKVVFWPNGDPLHFLSGAKQKWTKK